MCRHKYPTMNFMKQSKAQNDRTATNSNCSLAAPFTHAKYSKAFRHLQVANQSEVVMDTRSSLANKLNAFYALFELAKKDAPGLTPAALHDPNFGYFYGCGEEDFKICQHPQGNWTKWRFRLCFKSLQQPISSCFSLTFLKSLWDISEFSPASKAPPLSQS